MALECRKWGAPHFRHAKATHLLKDGMNIVQVSLLLGHEQLQTTMMYLDVTIEQKAEALATLENENNRKVPKRWKCNKASLANFCGVKPIDQAVKKKSKPILRESGSIMRCCCEWFGFYLSLDNVNCRRAGGGYAL